MDGGQIALVAIIGCEVAAVAGLVTYLLIRPRRPKPVEGLIIFVLKLIYELLEADFVFLFNKKVKKNNYSR